MKKPVVLLIKSRSLASKVIAYNPPTGILYVAASLRARLGADVRVIDALLETDILAAVRRAVRELSPCAVGVGALTAELFLANRIASVVKEESPSTPVVLGGPHASSDPAGTLDDPSVDAVVVGEGEETFTELISVICSEGPDWMRPEILRRVDGLAFRAPGGVELSAPRAFIQDLDALPFPAWDLIDYRRYWKLYGMASQSKRPYLTMFTSRGCPYHCVFCHHIFGKSFRARSPENVAEETAQALRLGAKHIEVLDDIANFDPNRFDGMLQLMLERGLNPVLSFPNAVRADLLRESSLDLLKRVGAGEVSVAVETASQRLQKLIRKDLRLDKVSRAIDMMEARKIATRGFFMLGLPTETRAEMQETMRFARNSRLHFAVFFVPNPYRNTELYEMYSRAGKLPQGLNPIDYEYISAPFNASEVPDPEFHRMYRWAYYGFYLNAARAFRVLRDGPPGWIPAQFVSVFANRLAFRRLEEEKVLGGGV